MSLLPAKTRMESPLPMRPGMPTAMMETPSSQKLQTEIVDSSSAVHEQQTSSLTFDSEEENNELI
jgi:hypothetical protein